MSNRLNVCEGPGQTLQIGPRLLVESLFNNDTSRLESVWMALKAAHRAAQAHLRKYSKAEGLLDSLA